MILALALLLAAQAASPADQARALAKEGKSAEAAAVLRKYVAGAPSSAEGHALLGMLLLGEGRVAEARPELETAMRLDPARPDAAEALARVHILEGQPAKAAALLKPLAADPALRVLYARALAASGDYAGAAELCERAMRDARDDDAAEAIYLALPAEALARRLAERFQRLQAAEDTAELIALGRVLSDMDPGRKTQAPALGEKLLARATEREPGNAQAWYQYGRALTRQAAPAAAFTAWEKALAAQPDGALRVRILTDVARRRRSVGQLDEAEAAFKAAQAANAKAHDAPAAFAWYEFLKAQSRPAEARRVLDEILEWNPLFPAARMELATAYAQRAQWKEAIAEAELALRLAQGDAALARNAHALLARAYSVTGQAAKAAPHQAWVEEHQPR